MEILASLFLFTTYSYSVCKHIVNTYAYISNYLDCWTSMLIPIRSNGNELQWECLHVVYMVNGNRNRLRRGMPRSPWWWTALVRYVEDIDGLVLLIMEHPLSSGIWLAQCLFGYWGIRFLLASCPKGYRLRFHGSVAHSDWPVYKLYRKRMPQYPRRHHYSPVRGWLSVGDMEQEVKQWTLQEGGLVWGIWSRPHRRISSSSIEGHIIVHPIYIRLLSISIHLIRFKFFAPL